VIASRGIDLRDYFFQQHRFAALAGDMNGKILLPVNQISHSPVVFLNREYGMFAGDTVPGHVKIGLHIFTMARISCQNRVCKSCEDI